MSLKKFDELGRKITLYTKEDIYNCMVYKHSPLQICIMLEYFGLLND